MTTRSSTPSTGAAGTSAADASIAAAIRLARTHSENFPVLGRFPGGRREELALIYAFCRTTDDLGDELPGDRHAALDRWEALVRRALAGDPPPDPPLLAPLAEVARRRELPADLFLRLIEANRRDQRVHRYPDRAALVDYCEHSATPVGRMVLGIIGSGRNQAELA
ncbi:MAG: phytoene/squalene synthase family protein, partial [Gemmatimonadota bacterium]